MVEHIHRIGATLPLLELTFTDPDTGEALNLSSLTSPVGHVRFKGKTTNAISSRALAATDPSNGRFDFAFLNTDFASPNETGLAVLWCTGTLGSDAFISEPIEIEVKEPWQI